MDLTRQPEDMSTPHPRHSQGGPIWSTPHPLLPLAYANPRNEAQKLLQEHFQMHTNTARDRGLRNDHWGFTAALLGWEK